VTNISHIPEALTKVMALNGMKPDFEPKGNLSLKPWFANNQGIKLPKELDVPVVEAVEPYNEQIEAISRQVGANFPRQTLKDASGASMMDPKTQVTKVHNLSILDASKRSFEENLVFSLTKEYPDTDGRALANIALNAFTNMDGDPALAAADAAREAESSPNSILSASVSILGKGRVKAAKEAATLFVDLFQHSGLQSGGDTIDYKDILAGLTDEQRASLTAADGDSLAAEIAGAIKKGSSLFVDFCTEAAGGKPSSDALLAAVWTSLGWSAFIKKKISRTTVVSLPWYSKIFSTFVGSSVAEKSHTADSFCGVKNSELITGWSFTETAFLALVGRRPSESELFEFSMLLGLIISNGPGTISAQGSKGGVSADGPEDPGRVQINKAFVGFLTHTGFAHGGNGYEAVAFLIEQFRDKGVKDPSDKGHGLDLSAIARVYATEYADYKTKAKAVGNLEYKKIPCVGHPIFKGNKVNFDPRERFVTELFDGKGIYNVFLDFYRHLVKVLFDAKVTREVFCVNVDAVIAVILLKMVWKEFAAGKVSDQDIESSGFTTFLFGRMIGCAAEIDDHINRGRNMDTRTPASKCTFVG
jgi:hypothetical protein